LQYEYGNVQQPSPAVGAELAMGAERKSLLIRELQSVWLLGHSGKCRHSRLHSELFERRSNQLLGRRTKRRVEFVQHRQWSTACSDHDGASLIDTLEMVLIIGTDATCPMTIQSVTVWQASSAGDVTSSLWTPLDRAANDNKYEMRLAA
jgi:hypothetical protein